MPLARKIPKRGFNNSQFRRTVEGVNLDVITGAFSSGEVVSKVSLSDKGLLTCTSVDVKILGRGELGFPLVFKDVSVSAAAKAKIISVGGRVE